MKRKTEDYLEDIIRECNYLMKRSKGLSYEQFTKNEDLTRAFVRSLEIIGEARRQIPVEIRRKYSQVQWRSIVGIRNILIHEYFGVNYEIIFKTVKERIPELGFVIKNILQEVEKRKDEQGTS